MMRLIVVAEQIVVGGFWLFGVFEITNLDRHLDHLSEHFRVIHHGRKNAKATFARFVKENIRSRLVAHGIDAQFSGLDEETEFDSAFKGVLKRQDANGIQR